MMGTNIGDNIIAYDWHKYSPTRPAGEPHLLVIVYLRG